MLPRAAPPLTPPRPGARHDEGVSGAGRQTSPATPLFPSRASPTVGSARPPVPPAPGVAIGTRRTAALPGSRGEQYGARGGVPERSVPPVTATARAGLAPVAHDQVVRRTWHDRDHEPLVRSGSAPATTTLAPGRSRPPGATRPPGLHQNARHAGRGCPCPRGSVLAQPADHPTRKHRSRDGGHRTRRRYRGARRTTWPASAGGPRGTRLALKSGRPRGAGGTCEPYGTDRPRRTRRASRTPFAGTTGRSGRAGETRGSRRTGGPWRPRRPRAPEGDLQLRLVAGRRILLAVELNRHAGRVRHQHQPVVLERSVQPLLHELRHVHDHEAAPVLHRDRDADSARPDLCPARSTR